MTATTPSPARWQLYTVEEAAAYLDMGKSTLRRLVADDKNPLPHHNVRGVGVHFTAADLDAILAEAQRGRVR